MKRTDPYTGPFPRGRHSHRCLRCGENAVACYKSQCTRAQTEETCSWCEHRNPQPKAKTLTDTLQEVHDAVARAVDREKAVWTAEHASRDLAFRAGGALDTGKSCIEDAPLFGGDRQGHLFTAQEIVKGLADVQTDTEGK